MSALQPTAAPPAGPTNLVQAMLEAPLSLRERKKLKTRQAIRREAYRLIAEQGYENTTVDQIAAAAEVSQSTFFRYFATKEDLVLTDEYDPAMVTALLARPADEPFLHSCREAVIGLMRELLQHEREELLTRMRLVNDVPVLRARMHEAPNDPQQLYLTVLTRRAGVEQPTLDMRITAAAVGAATTEVVLHWAESGGQDDIADLVDHAFAVLERGFRGV
ncbi:TetR family transcriptional regulator [Kitasatospora sp. NPDC058170]|uniref:TetR family transcriptional regulator n=1 Tax=Kitasatospora sp. NPDC058170 TaxID=3346364 RepID=UPI0036D88B69